MQGEVTLALQRDPEGWSANDKLMVVLVSWAGLVSEQVDRSRQAFQDAKAKPVPILVVCPKVSY